MVDVSRFLAPYYDAWNTAFNTKDDAQIRSFMSRDFHGFWAHSGITEPEQYGFDYDIVGVLRQYDDAEKSFETSDVAERNEGKEIVILGTEMSIINGKPHHAKAMLVWRYEENAWKLLREYIELTR